MLLAASPSDPHGVSDLCQTSLIVSAACRRVDAEPLGIAKNQRPG